MYGLLALYLGYFVYLFLFFYFASNTKYIDLLYKKITIVLGIKLAILTVLYFFFFSEKMSQEERKENIQKLILK